MFCNSCHPDGKGLSGIGKKTTGFKNPAGTFTTLPETINRCITVAFIEGRSAEGRFPGDAEHHCVYKVIEKNKRCLH